MITVKATVVESSICITDTQCQTRSSRIRQVIIDKIQVVSSEICVAKWCAVGYVVTSGSTASQTAVECWGYGKRRCIRIVVASCTGCACSVVPNHIDSILGVVIGELGLAEQSQGAWTGDVDLFGVVARKNEDIVWDCVVWDRENGRLNTGELCFGADQEGSLGTALEWVLGWVLAFASAVGLRCTQKAQRKQGYEGFCDDHLDRGEGWRLARLGSDACLYTLYLVAVTEDLSSNHLDSASLSRIYYLLLHCQGKMLSPGASCGDFLGWFAEGEGGDGV